MARAANEAPPVMTWGKATPLLAVCVVFDALRLFFESFWFFGPALAGIFCSLGLSSTLSSWTFGILGAGTATTLCSAGAATLGVAGFSFMAPLGVIMSMAVGLFGWMTIGLWIVMTNSRLFKENSLVFGASLLASEVPLLNAVPALTIVVSRMYAVQIRQDRIAFKKYQKERQARARAEAQQEQQMFIVQAQTQAANDEASRPQDIQRAA